MARYCRAMKSEEEQQTDRRVEGVAFLLVQLGFRAARRFGERLAPLGLEQRHAGLLRAVAIHEGQSQQDLGDALGIPKSRMVWLVDDLEQRGLVERQRNASDRRAYALHLTPDGRRRVAEVRTIIQEHEREITAGLQPAERKALAELLRKIAAHQGVLGDTLPGPAPDGQVHEEPG
ncbi:MAG TPA: MarR family transcriptional regulator [Chloroflexota bacterium]